MSDCRLVVCSTDSPGHVLRYFFIDFTFPVGVAGPLRPRLAGLGLASSLRLFRSFSPFLLLFRMGFAVRVRSAGQKYGPTCHQSDRADVTEFVTLVRLSSLGQHVGVLALAGYLTSEIGFDGGPYRHMSVP